MTIGKQNNQAQKGAQIYNKNTNNEQNDQKEKSITTKRGKTTLRGPKNKHQKTQNK